MNENAWWNPDSCPFHIKPDAQQRNDNIAKGHKLCKRCEGTGNELYSMYRECSTCNGTGISPQDEVKE